MLYYAVFNLHPAKGYPFELELGFQNEVIPLKDCESVADAVQKMEEYCQNQNIDKSPRFTLLYPIYLDVMDTDYEMTMFGITEQIFENAMTKGWAFNRVGGLTNQRPADFIR
jgi:hypothetical protein